MALISNAKGRKVGSGYERMLGDTELGELISKIHATSISAGTELEKLIQKDSNVITDLDLWLGNLPTAGCYLAPKKVLKMSKYALNGNEPDMLVFTINKNKHCSVIEVKDGDQFDTKKAEGEINRLYDFRNHIAPSISFTTSIHICCFNQMSKQKIVEGFKNKITRNEVMTGRELCILLGISYDKIVATRKVDQHKNLVYLFTQFMCVDVIRLRLRKVIIGAIRNSQILNIKKFSNLEK